MNKGWSILPDYLSSVSAVDDPTHCLIVDFWGIDNSSDVIKDHFPRVSPLLYVKVMYVYTNIPIYSALRVFQNKTDFFSQSSVVSPSFMNTKYSRMKLIYFYALDLETDSMNYASVELLENTGCIFIL